LTQVVGPGRRGVVVATPDLQRARRDQVWLEEHGFQAELPADAGLRAVRPAADADIPDPRAVPAEFWATTTRRPTLASDEDGVFVAISRRSAVSTHLLEALALIEEAAARRWPPRVAVFGGAWIGEHEPEYREASRLGYMLADRGVEVVNGGYQGIMAAVSLGAAEAHDPVVVGITIEPWSTRVPVNEWLTHEVQARDLFARLPLIADADAWVAFPGGVGTLSEIALCWNLVQTQSVEPRPLVIVGERWDRALRTFRELLIAEEVHFDMVGPASDADGAWDMLSELVPVRR
jgi:uncharacterized protein (TIGR00730 family)